MAAVESIFQHYSKGSGIQLHPHQLRHTHATELVLSYLHEGQQGDWKFIQERLGHASVVTTMETYVHLEREDHQRAYHRFATWRDAAHAPTQEKEARRATLYHGAT